MFFFIVSFFLSNVLDIFIIIIVVVIFLKESGKNTTLKSISASGHSISNEALQIFGSALASQSTSNFTSKNNNKNNDYHGIQSIAIGDEKMGNKGIISLCTNLKKVNGGLLQNIDFAFKSISQSGAECIGSVFGSSLNLKKLILYRNTTMGDDGLIALCDAAAVQSIKSNSISSSLSSSSTGLRPFPVLECLDLSECNIGIQGIESLVSCLVGSSSRSSSSSERQNIDEGTHQVTTPTSLLDLKLNSNPIGSKSCNHLKQLISCSSSSSYYGHSLLKVLSLNNCSIGDEGMEILANTILNHSCKHLTSLDLSNNGIGSNGIMILAKALKDGKQNVPNLNEICLADNSIGEEGVIALAKSLSSQGVEEENSKGNATLSKLDLTNTNCGIDGALALMQCTSLSSLRLFNNNLGSTGIEALSTQLVGGHAYIEHLDIGGNRGNGDSVAKLLKAIMEDKDQSNFKNALKTLELGGNENNNEDLFAAAREKRPEMDIAQVKETPKDVPDDS